MSELGAREQQLLATAMKASLHDLILQSALKNMISQKIIDPHELADILSGIRPLVEEAARSCPELVGWLAGWVKLTKLGVKMDQARTMD